MWRVEYTYHNIKHHYTCTHTLVIESTKWSHVCLLCWDMKYNVSCVGGGALKVSHCRIQVWIGAWVVRNNSDKHLIIARYWTKSIRIAAIGWKHRYHTMVLRGAWVWLTLVPRTMLLFWGWHLLNAKHCVLFSPWPQYTTRHHTLTVCVLHIFCHVGCAAAWVENFEWEWGILGSQRSWSLENERWKVMFLSSRYSNFKLLSSHTYREGFLFVRHWWHLWRYIFLKLYTDDGWWQILTESVFLWHSQTILVSF